MQRTRCKELLPILTIAIPLATIVLLGAAVPPAAALPTEVHAIISFEAARLPGVPDEVRNPDILGTPEDHDAQDQDITICAGAYDEDADRVPSALYQIIRLLDPNTIWGWGNHFWNPLAGPDAGQLLILNPPPMQNAYQRASILYGQALVLYQTDPEQAWYILGRVSHLLEDMATPAHTHLDPHVSTSLAGFLRDPFLDSDSFEDYLEHNYVSSAQSPSPADAPGITQFENTFVSPGPTPVPLAWLSDAGHPELGDLYKLFYSMAMHAVQWDSNDADGIGPIGIGQGSIRHNHHISDADCRRMAGVLVPAAVAHVATLYRIFYRDTHPDQASQVDISSLPGDINTDNTVGTQDLLRLATAFGTSAGSPSYDPACDLNADTNVNVADLQILVTHFGWISAQP